MTDVNSVTVSALSRRNSHEFRYDLTYSSPIGLSQTSVR